MEMWTVRSALEWTCGYLERHGDEHPRLSAEWLLCAATGFSRVEVYMNYDRPLDASERDILREGVKRRGKGEPLQYVTGEMPFRHIVLKCAPGVLIPRPETEVLVDCVLEFIDAQDGAQRVLEVGTGTGCISLSIAGERPGTSIVATDISDDAIALATRNREVLNCEDSVEIVQTDIAQGVEGTLDAGFDVLVSNPPYIPSALVDILPREVGGYEPRLALDGGADGLDVFHRIVECAKTALRPGGLMAFELHEDCLQLAAQDARVVQDFTDIRVVKDLTGRDRILLALRK
jgi:release factor glutamine methyltransferase